MILKHVTVILLNNAVLQASAFTSFIEKKMMIKISISSVISTIPQAIIKTNRRIRFSPILNQVNSIKLPSNSPQLPTNTIKINHD